MVLSQSQIVVDIKPGSNPETASRVQSTWTWSGQLTNFSFTPAVSSVCANITMSSRNISQSPHTIRKLSTGVPFHQAASALTGSEKLSLSSRVAYWLAQSTIDSAVNVSFSLFSWKDLASAEKVTHGEIRRTPLSREDRVRDGMPLWAWRRLEMRPRARFPPAEPPPIAIYSIIG